MTREYRGFKIITDRRYFNIIRTDVETGGLVKITDKLKTAKWMIDEWHDNGMVFKMAFVAYSKANGEEVSKPIIY